MRRKMNKKVLAWLLVISMVLPMISNVFTAKAADITDYNAMEMEEIFQSDEALTWVFAGDSITHNDVWTQGMNSYGEWFEQYLYDVKRYDDNVIIPAWSGADLYDFQTYANTPSGNGAKSDPGMGIENQITKYNPDVVFIKLGMNDRDQLTSTFTEYYQKIIDSIYDICATSYNKKPKIVLLSPSPMSSENLYDDKHHTNPDTDVTDASELNQDTTLRIRNAVESVANDNDLLFCDLRTAFLNEALVLGDDYAYTFFSDPSDGKLHPNAAGQYFMFKTLSKTIGIYDETKAIYQVKYDDINSAALYVDETSGVTYDGGYGNSNVADDDEEMDKAIPSVGGPQIIASVDFTADNGDFGTDSGETAYIDLVNGEEVQDKLTLDEVKSLGKEFSIVFRAKILTPASAGNQPILYFGADKTAKWSSTSALMLSVPGTNKMFYGMRPNGSTTLNTATNWNNKSAFVDDGWHTFALVQTEDNLTVYIDGVATVAKRNSTSLYLTKDIGAMFADATADKFEALIGKYGAQESGYNLNGNFDYWQLYDGALPVAEIAELTNAAGSDEDEMNATMPSTSSISTKTALSNVDFTSENGVFGTTIGGRTYVDLVNGEDVQNKLTADEVKSMGKEYTVVFRAKVLTPTKADDGNNGNQSVFYIGADKTLGWNKTTSLMLSVPGWNKMYYSMAGKTNFTGTAATWANKSAMADDNWHTFVLVQSASNLTVYVDDGEGQVALSSSGKAAYLTEDIGTVFASITDETFEAILGRYGSADTQYGLKGKLDYWQLYDGAFTTDEIQTLLDKNEMNSAMPKLGRMMEHKVLSSIDFNSSNGTFSTADDYVDLVNGSEVQNKLTLSEVQSMGKEYTVVFRAKLGTPDKAGNQPILYLGQNNTVKWSSTNSLLLSVPGRNKMYYDMRNGQSNFTGTASNWNDRTEFVDESWHTFVVVQSADNLTVYIDGVGEVVKSGSGKAAFLKTDIGTNFANATEDTFEAMLGRFGIKESGYNLKGKFDYWQLYDGAFTQAQVDAITGEATDKLSWSNAFGENYLWTVTGAEQLSGYEGPVVNRSIFRLVESAVRGGSGISSYRDIRMVNASAPGYTLATVNEKFDSIIGKYNADVLMILPEISEVYEENYDHTGKVEAYIAEIEELLAKQEWKAKILWTPLASSDETINTYITDYANAVRELAEADTSILFFDANKFMNENMEANEVLKRNWFEDDMYISPLCAVDVSNAFLTLMNQSGFRMTEVEGHNLRLSEDTRVFKGDYVRDYIEANVSVSEAEVTVDVTPITTVYPDLTNIKVVLMPTKGAGNFHEDIMKLADVTTTCTFEAPCSDMNLAVYGEQDGKIYRFKDIALTATTDATITKETPNPDGAYLDALEIVGAPAIAFDKDTTSYDVTLYQYQQWIQVNAKAQDGLTITVNGTEAKSGVNTGLIEVGDATQITVTVSGMVEGEEASKTYTLNVTRPEYPDIIITEVMQDGYSGETLAGGDNYELIEVYNASGRDLNLLDYSIGFKIDFPESSDITTQNQWPYYFTGNNQGFANAATYTGINQITKYSSYWNDGTVTEPEKVIFPADSTMVIWLKFTPASKTAEYGETLTYDTLRASLAKYAGEDTLTVDIDGTDTVVVPTKDQLVVAEIPKGAEVGYLQARATNHSDDVVENYYMENFASIDGGAKRRGWLFVLGNDAERATNGAITEAGNDIISASKFMRLSGSNRLSSVFYYDVERGMSFVKDTLYWDADTLGDAHTSDQQGYQNMTSFGAIEYWQKPSDMADKTAPAVAECLTDEGIRISVTDDTDIRYLTLNVRKGTDGEVVTVKKDLVLESGVRNAGVSEDITSYIYNYALDVTEDEEIYYWGTIIDGNGNEAAFGSDASATDRACEYEIVKYDDISTYRGDTKTAPTLEGYLFAGWFTDDTCSEEAALDTSVTSGEAWAKFVPAHVLDVKAQISANLVDDDATNDGTGSIRFVTSVDTLLYREIGFKYAYNGKEGVSSSNKVYAKLYAIGADTLLTYTPSDVFCVKSTYFKACTFVKIPSTAYDTEITVTPFWITVDGTTVYGEPVTKTVSQGMK